MVADRYFSNTVDGLMGSGSLIPSSPPDLNKALARREIIAEVWLDGETDQYRRKTAVYVGLARSTWSSSLGYYFRDIPEPVVSAMTEPRVAALPGAVLDLFIREAERIPGVRFAFRDGSSIAVLLTEEANTKQVTNALKELLQGYRLLEVRLPDGYQVDNTVETGRELASLLAGQGGVSLVRDVTSGQSSDQQQALLLTMSEMKKFLLSYAGQVKIIPGAEQSLNKGICWCSTVRKAIPSNREQRSRMRRSLSRSLPGRKTGRCKG